LLNALERRGHKVLADQTDLRNVALVVAGERVEFSLTERQRQFKEELTDQQRRSPSISDVSIEFFRSQLAS
jgi:hypothetical protein